MVGSVCVCVCANGVAIRRSLYDGGYMVHGRQKVNGQRYMTELSHLCLYMSY